MARPQKQTWASTKPEHERGLTAIRSELGRSVGGVLSPARNAFGQRSQGLPLALVNVFEVLADLSVSPVGRLVTATAAATGAWLLL